MKGNGKSLVTTEAWDDTWHQALTWQSKGLGGLGFLRLRQRLWWRLDAAVSCIMEAVHRSDPDVLELGCGSGKMLERIHHARPNCRLHGIDYSEVGIGLARRYLRGLGIQATLFQGDVFEYEIERRFDAVVSFGLIEHFQDPVAAIQCHARFTAPRGIVAVTVPNFSPPLMKRYLQRFAPEILERHNLTIMDKGALRNALQKAGLDDVSVGGFGAPWLAVPTNMAGLPRHVFLWIFHFLNLFAQLPAPLLWPGYLLGIGRVIPRAWPN